MLLPPLKQCLFDRKIFPGNDVRCGQDHRQHKEKRDRQSRDLARVNGAFVSEDHSSFMKDDDIRASDQSHDGMCSENKGDGNDASVRPTGCSSSLDSAWRSQVDDRSIATRQHVRMDVRLIERSESRDLPGCVLTIGQKSHRATQVTLVPARSLQRCSA